MTPTLTLDDIFSKCRIKGATKITKQHACETLDKFFAHLQSKGEIKSYERVKKEEAHPRITSPFFSLPKIA